MNKKRIIIDFDGTICGFKFPDCGPPEPGVKEALQEIRDMGYEIVIHSCRTSSIRLDNPDLPDSLSEFFTIQNFMVLHNLPFDVILTNKNHDKPSATFYIDDCGVSYRGSWPDVVNEIKERKEK